MVPMSYALIGFFIILPVLSYDIFFFYHYYLLLKDQDWDATLNLDTLDFILYALMGIGQTIS